MYISQHFNNGLTTALISFVWYLVWYVYHLSRKARKLSFTSIYVGFSLNIGPRIDTKSHWKISYVDCFRPSSQHQIHGLPENSALPLNSLIYSVFRCHDFGYSISIHPTHHPQKRAPNPFSQLVKSTHQHWATDEIIRLSIKALSSGILSSGSDRQALVFGSEVGCIKHIRTLTPQRTSPSVK